MEFISENCVQEIEAPGELGVCRFDYNGELNLIATIDIYCDGVVVWNPDTGEIVKEICTIARDVLFLPGHHVAVSWCDGEYGFGVKVCSFDSGEVVIDERNSIEHKFVATTLSPANTLLFASNKSGIYESKVNFDTKSITNLKNSNRDVLCESVNIDVNILSMCCSKYNYTICISYGDDHNGFYCVEVMFSSDGKTTGSTISKITHCFIKGKKVELGKVTALVHDGENIIVNTKTNVIVLETADEGSIGHVIVSHPRKPPRMAIDDTYWHQLKINNKNQLMVCNGSDVIKVYEYKLYNTLQQLCRFEINNTILKQNKEKIDKLPLPNPVKNYLLYKT